METGTHASAPSLHTTIVCADVAGFGDRVRSNADQIAIRAGLYKAMRAACLNSGVEWASCHREDRGDGIVIVAPPSVSNVRLAVDFPRELSAELDKHNRAHEPRARFQLRLAIHAGAVRVDANGVAGSSLIHAFRLLEARALKRALTDSSARLALILSEGFFDEFVRHHSTGDRGVYRPIEVSVKETRTGAWIRLFGDPPQLAQPSHDDDFDVFYIANFRLVRNVINTRARDWTLAADVTDEAMAIAYRKWGELAEHPNPIGFVIVTARRILSKIQRQQARKAPPVPPLSLEATPGLEPSEHGTDPADTAINRAALDQALRALPIDQRECLVLHEILGQPIKQIAELLNLPEGTVKTRLRAARQALRNVLNDDFGDGGRP